jgi:hypothetical protein
MDGKLIPCPELKYRSLLVNFTVLPKSLEDSFCWKGRSGFCRNCEIEFEVTTQTHFSLNNSLSHLIHYHQHLFLGYRVFSLDEYFKGSLD